MVSSKAVQSPGLGDTHRRPPRSGQKRADLGGRMPWLASILLPSQRAGAAIGSQALPRDLKCNRKRLEQQRDCSWVGPYFS